MGMKKRFGTFLVIIGFFLLLLFLASDYLERANGWYLFYGVLLTAFGSSLVWKSRTPPQPSQRFRTVRKLFGKETGQQKDSEDGENQQE